MPIRLCIRKILNDLSSDAPGVTKIEEGKPEEEGAPSGIPAMAVPTSLYQTSTGQYSMYSILSDRMFNFQFLFFVLQKDLLV